MDTKANLANRKKINELAIQHNKLTTLVSCLLNEINHIKKELHDTKNSDNSSKSSNEQSSSNNSKNNQNRFSNFNDLRAEDILKQLSINNIDN
jgi:hypothetical protein